MTDSSNLPFVLFGAGGHAREVAEIIRHSGERSGTAKLLGFLDENKAGHGDSIDGFPVLGGLDWLEGNVDTVQLIVAIGHIPSRKRIVERVTEMGARFGQVISPAAQFYGSSVLGEGCMIFPQVVVSSNVTIGRHVILGVHSSVSHDSKIGDFSFLCPGARVTGGVTLGTEVMLGTNASVIPCVTLGHRVTIGAGAAVIRDIADGVTAVGVPAKPVL